MFRIQLDLRLPILHFPGLFQPARLIDRRLLVSKLHQSHHYWNVANVLAEMTRLGKLVLSEIQVAGAKDMARSIGNGPIALAR